MSQEQLEKPSDPSETQQQQDPIKYGNVFPVSGELASKPIAPLDAAAMQVAENRVFGQIQTGGPAAVMQAAATINEMAGVVNQDDATDLVQKEGVNVTGTDIQGGRIITESIGGQVSSFNLSFGDLELIYSREIARTVYVNHEMCSFLVFTTLD